MPAIVKTDISHDVSAYVTPQDAQIKSSTGAILIWLNETLVAAKYIITNIKPLRAFIPLLLLFNSMTDKTSTFTQNTYPKRRFAYLKYKTEAYGDEIGSNRK